MSETSTADSNIKIVKINVETHAGHNPPGPLRMGPIQVRVSECAYPRARTTTPDAAVVSVVVINLGAAAGPKNSSLLYMCDLGICLFQRAVRESGPVRLMHFRGNAQKCSKMVVKYTFLAPNGVYWSVKWFKWVSNANMYTCSKLVAVFCEIVTSFAYFSMIFVGKREDFGVSRPAAMEK